MAQDRDVVKKIGSKRRLNRAIQPAQIWAQKMRREKLEQDLYDQLRRQAQRMAGAIITGKYKLLQEIGQGGIGVVWMAEQRTPVRRLVAVKLIKAGMDSKSVIARFEAESSAGDDGSSQYRPRVRRRHHRAGAAVFRDGTGPRAAGRAILRPAADGAVAKGANAAFTRSDGW